VLLSRLTTNSVNRLRKALWFASGGLSILAASQIAWACNSGCPANTFSGSCSSGETLTSMTFNPDCCTWFEGGGHGCCDFPTLITYYCTKSSGTNRYVGYAHPTAGTPHTGQYCDLAAGTCGP
jgi:hypothetical protein